MSILALDSRVATALAVTVGISVFAVMLLVTAAGDIRGRRSAKVPPGFRPAPSDEELERRVLERYLAWGAISVLFMAIWLPIYWLREPTRLREKRAQFHEQGIESEGTGNFGGRKLFDDLCAQCHGKDMSGGFSKFRLNEREVNYPEPPLKFIYDRYMKAGRSEDEVTQIIYDAINRGRPGTPMPTWGLQFGGPLNSRQVDTIVDYIRSVQDFSQPADSDVGSEIFAANCAVCHGPRGEGLIGPNLQVALARLTPEQVAEVIHDGRINLNRPSMPAWAHLGDDAIAALVEFIESIQRSEA